MTDYEKKYKEAVEKLRSLYDNYEQVSNLINLKEELEEIFPELKESDGARAKREIIDFLKCCCEKEVVKAIDAANWIAWLELQGEQKPADWSEDDEMRFKNLCWLIDRSGEGEATRNGFKNWLKSLRPKSRQWRYIDRSFHATEVLLVQKNDKSDAFNGYALCADHTISPDRYERYIRVSDI